MSLSVSVQQVYGGFRLDAAFESPGGLTALFGPSGCGKTSIVRFIAGLLRPQQGRIALGGSVLVDTANRRFVPPHRRGIGYVFQEPRLLPHLSVRQNLLYGRWFARRFRRPPAETASFERVVELLGIGGLLGRPPGALSGGEAQRVAIGRALLAAPRLLLMDEPFASIDEVRKAEILPYVERLRDELEIPIVYVSHALDEVVRLATTLVVLERGRVLAHGPLGELLSRIDLPNLARRLDAGVVLEAEVVGHDPRWQLTQLRIRAGSLLVPSLALPPGHGVRVWIRARDVSLSADPPGASSVLNVFPARVVELAPGADASTDVRLDCAGDALLARITRLSAERLQLRPGRTVHALVKGVSFQARV
jgi:molybdate transport system ATP-binding protein